MKPLYDVVILGAGVVGALTARELARYDLRVLVLERQADAAMGATKANSGIVHGGYAESHTELKGRLCLPGRQAFAQLETELNFGLRLTGSLVVAFPGQEAGLQVLWDRGRANGLTDLKLLSQAELREREPRISRAASAALYCAGAGVCSPWDLAYAALENALANGVELRLQATVEAFRLERPDSFGESRWIIDWRSADGSSQSLSTRFVINAAGLGAAALDGLAGLPPWNLETRTGEYLVFGPDSGRLVNSVLFQLPTAMGKGVLITPTYQGNLLLGPDAVDETGSLGSLASTHEDRLRRIWDQARNLVDGLDSKQVIRSFSGIRPLAPNRDFALGSYDAATFPGWHRAVGIQSPGLTASPAIAARLIAGLAAEGLLLQSRAAFNPYRPPLATHVSRRPARLGFDELAGAIKLPVGNPDRVVCRCEQVRESAIAEALGRNPPCLSLDGLKRRTRASMGWCQGQFCRPRLLELLGNEAANGDLAQSDVERLGATRLGGSDIRKLLDYSQRT